MELDYIVGEGAYGKVHRGLLVQSGETIAVKVVNLSGDHDEEAEIALEIDVLANFSQHQNVARFFGAYCHLERDSRGKTSAQLWLAMEFCACGSASGLVRSVRNPKPSPNGASQLVPKPGTACANVSKHCSAFANVPTVPLLLLFFLFLFPLSLASFCTKINNQKHAS